MIDKEKYPKLYENTENTIRTRREWLEQAIKAQELCDLLPDEIKGMHFIDADYSPGTLSLKIRNANGTVPTLKRLGIQGLKPQVSIFSKETFWTEGTGKLPNGTFLSIRVSHIDKPEDCTVIEKRRMRKEYLLVCEKTGTEIK